MAFTVFAPSKRKYVHPYFCFWKDYITSHQGFSTDKDDDSVQHDLPNCYVPALKTWSQKIHEAISRKNVFPIGICEDKSPLSTHMPEDMAMKRSSLSHKWTTPSITITLLLTFGLHQNNVRSRHSVRSSTNILIASASAPISRISTATLIPLMN